MPQSLSDHPEIVANRQLAHKIGATGNDVKRRIAGAKNDATFLLADGEIVATYQLANFNRYKVEKVIHAFLAPARMDIEIRNRFGKSVVARKWFLVPIFVIDERRITRDQAWPQLVEIFEVHSDCPQAITSQ